MTTPKVISRAAFLRRSIGLFALSVFDVDRGWGLVTRPLEVGIGLQHPEPRPGITAEKVLPDDALGVDPGKNVLAAYAAARSYPEVFDGLACACDCGGPSGYHRSLLSCYESMQPTGCHPCQTEAQLVAKMARQKKSLADIRKAVDKRYS